VFTVAKAIGNGLPIGALLAKEHVAQAMQPGTHGSTYGGNPVAAAGACAVYDELHERGAMARGAEGAARLVKRLEELQAATGLIETIRGRGMWVGVVLKDDRAGKVLGQARLRGLLINSVGERVLRFAPSLLITDQEIDEGARKLHEALEAAGA
jgi:acetylornithine/succinyldiaminopimelate/putrescine aminotransferase